MLEEWMDCKLVPTDQSVSEIRPLSRVYRFDEAIHYFPKLPSGGFIPNEFSLVAPGSIIFLNTDLFKIIFSINKQVVTTAATYTSSELSVGTKISGETISLGQFGSFQVECVVQSISKVEPVGVFIDNRHLWAIQCQILRQRDEQAKAREQLKKDIFADVQPQLDELKARIAELTN